jgi:Na+-translocating ferredoxin:NAD+ oxidoreductase RnfG subunit
MRKIPSLLLVPPALVAAAVPAYAADYLTIPQAQHALFPAADQFVDATVALDDGQRTAIEKLSGVRQRWKKQAVWRAEKDGTLLGWFIVDDVVGKHEYITYATALSADAKVLGIEVLSYRETHGYQIREADWRNRFVGKTLADPFKLDQDIPNISGATLSCRNITNGVKRLLALHQVVLVNAR